VAFNAYQKRIRVIIDQATALGHVVLAHVEGEVDGLRFPSSARQAALSDRDDLLSDATAALAVRTVKHGGS
jgi:hypothetical protein